MGIKLSKTGAYLLCTDGYHFLQRRFIVICGFPGVGKSSLAERKEIIAGISFKKTDVVKWRLVDLESSNFPKEDFPDNYIERIRVLEENAHKHNQRMIVFCSSHSAVREALRQAGIEFLVAYPNKALKEEYLDRYLSRKQHPMPLKIVMDNFDKWIDEIESEEGVKLELFSGQYLSDVITTTRLRL